MHEVDRTSRGERRLRGKDDQLDAVRAARSPSRTRASGKAAGRRASGGAAAFAAGEANRGRHAQGRARAAAQRDRHRPRRAPRRAASLPLGELLDPLQSLPPLQLADAAQLATILVLRTLARRIQTATAEAETLEREILSHVRALVPKLLDDAGIGPIVAAGLIVSWSHHDRIDSEACSLALAGVAPLPASSGQTTRHRLSRGGDRQLNRALHTIVLHRRQHDPATRDYSARRIAEGKTSRDAVRLLKRYLARHLYRVMQNSTPLTT